MINTDQVNWKLLFFEGTLFSLLGIFAVANPFVTAMTLEALLGALLIITAITHGLSILNRPKSMSPFPLAIGSLFALATGVILLMYPLTGVLTLTLLFTVYFLLDGVTRMTHGWQFRPTQGWFWLFFSGLISILFAILILNDLPTTAVWVLGVYFGMHIALFGTSLIFVALSVKKERG